MTPGLTHIAKTSQAWTTHAEELTAYRKACKKLAEAEFLTQDFGAAFKEIKGLVKKQKG